MFSKPQFIRCVRSAHPKAVHYFAPSMNSPAPSVLCGRVFSTSTRANNLLLRDDDKSTGITTLKLNSPHNYNVLSWDMLDTLQEQIDDIATSESIRVLVVGATGKAFSAGHDLKELRSHQSIDETRELFSKCSRLMISLNKLPQPVIAMVQGVATAGGCQLVASCDLAVASSYARFGVSGINVGL